MLALVVYAEATQSVNASFNHVTSNPDYVNLSKIQGVVIDLKYASLDNFMKENLYADFHEAFLHRLAAEMLKDAVRRLQMVRSSWKLLVFDALRPRSVQRLLWSRVQGTPRQPYVANPETASNHNFGFAIDLTLVDESGKEVDMGTRFDDFSKLSEPRLEDTYLDAGKLTALQISNRRVLRKIMTEAGFSQQPNEWWHYDGLPAKEVRARYQIVE